MLENLFETKEKNVDAVELINRIEENVAVASTLNCANWPSISGYELLSAVGAGGMGIVFKARRRSADFNDKLFAIKVLRAELVQEVASKKRFEAEARACAQLDNPHCATIYEYGTTSDGRQFFVMDYIEGRSLADVLKEQTILSLTDFISIFIQITEAISEAHRLRIVHRDLKPSNIMLERREDAFFVKVVDFGIAQVLSCESEENLVTQTGQVIGSPAYMSPEQCRGDLVDERSDIYSLGCVMFEALSGRPPFTAANSVKIILQHLSDSPPDLADFAKNRKIPQAVPDIIYTCLAKTPEDRFQSAQEVRDALELLADPESKKNQNKLRRTTRSKKLRSFLRNHDKQLFLCLSAACAFIGTLAIFIVSQIQDGSITEQIVEAKKAQFEGRFDSAEEHWREAIAKAELQRKSARELAELHLQLADCLAIHECGHRDSIDLGQASEERLIALTLYEQVPGTATEKIPIIDSIIEHSLETNLGVGLDYVRPFNGTKKLESALNNLDPFILESMEYHTPPPPRENSFSSKYKIIEGLLLRKQKFEEELFGKAAISSVPTLCDLADIAYLQGNLPTAESHLREVVRLQQEWDRVYTSIARYDGRHGMCDPSLVDLAVILTDEGKYAEAEQIFQKQLSQTTPTTRDHNFSLSSSIGCVSVKYVDLLFKSKQTAKAQSELAKIKALLKQEKRQRPAVTTLSF